MMREKRLLKLLFFPVIKKQSEKSRVTRWQPKLDLVKASEKQQAWRELHPELLLLLSSFKPLKHSSYLETSHAVLHRQSARLFPPGNETVKKVPFDI